eukprot:TRINITY_DN1826_c0_g1_i1.p1 TRINITY_DN1826_c0_g1~~TRINITY_DN1826_c0_g1_i1.p1  ORF type:complete len:320 (+),score=65.06 TRINITY_DN1826_c0_g1_i1:180-1139(+)
MLSRNRKSSAPILPIRSMETELKHIWSKPIEDQPVYKDLPRLVRRITVLGAEEPKTTSTDSTSETQSTPVDGLDEEKKLERRTSNFRLSVPLGGEWREEVDKLEEIPPSPVISPRILHVLPSSSTSNTQQQQQTPVQVTPITLYDDIKRVILTVAKKLEPERYESIREGLEKQKVAERSVLEMVVADVFREVLGRESKVAKVFKAVHQNIIFAACYQVKTLIPLKWMTKDVRGPEGWLISIQFSPGAVSVSHRRREESLATEVEKFWFEWELHMTFDANMDEMQASVLKVTQLGFGDNVSQLKKESIKKALCSGRMIVA